MATRDVSSMEAMAALAGEIAGGLKGGEVIGLVGDLGAGKTTFVQLLAKALGINKEVRSPTFILMQVFDVPVRPGSYIRQLCHVDAYRFEDEQELKTIGFADFAGRNDVACVVEWADKTPFLRKMKGYREIRLVLDVTGKRTVEIG